MKPMDRAALDKNLTEAEIVAQSPTEHRFLRLLRQMLEAVAPMPTKAKQKPAKSLRRRK
jgi:hypothetical protein